MTTLDALPHTPTHRNRFTFLDAARALAAICVLLQHSLEASGIETLAHGAIATTWINLGETGVGIFFLISGFIIPASMRGTPTFIKFWMRRVFRIYPLYIFVFIATIIIYTSLYKQDLPPIARTITSHLLLLQPWLHLPNYVGGAWTLLIEMVWYGVFSVAFFSVFGVGLRLIIAFIITYGLTIALAAVFYGTFPFGRISILALCFLGYLYLLRMEGNVSKSLFSGVLILFIVLISSSLYIGFYIYPNKAADAPTFSCVVISWSIALIIFPFLLAFREKKLINLRILSFLGEISYSLYLIHTPVMLVLKHFEIKGIIFVGATFLFTIIISIITYNYIEIPAINLARRLTRSNAVRT